MAFNDSAWIFEEEAFSVFTEESFDKLPPKGIISESGKKRGKFDLKKLEKLLSEPEENVEIKKTDFYRNEYEKTRQNWFAYKLALCLYEGYQKNLLHKFRQGESVDRRRMVEFAIFYAREMTEPLLDALQNDQAQNLIKTEVIEKFFGLRHKKLIKLLIAISEKQILSHIEYCRKYSEKYFLDRKQYCPDFD